MGGCLHSKPIVIPLAVWFPVTAMLLDGRSGDDDDEKMCVSRHTGP
jgi:hypothetical protein